MTMREAACRARTKAFFPISFLLSSVIFLFRARIPPVISFPCFPLCCGRTVDATVFRPFLTLSQTVIGSDGAGKAGED
jgi:hypothetical protein